jgi:hypothetical protein
MMQEASNDGESVEELKFSNEKMASLLQAKET